MSEANQQTKHSVHAAKGKSRAIKVEVQRPDTVLNLPDGRQWVLRRSEPTITVPSFQKFTPGKGNDAKAGGMSADTRTAQQKAFFGKFIIAAVVATQVFTFVRRRFLMRKKPQQEVQQYEGEYEEEEEVDEQTAAQAQAVQARLLPHMMRMAMPKAARKSLPTRLAEANRQRPRNHTTSKQMMHPKAAAAAGDRKPGVLKQWDQQLRREVREVMAQQGQGQQQALPAPAARLSLPAATAASAGAAGPSGSSS